MAFSEEELKFIRGEDVSTEEESTEKKKSAGLGDVFKELGKTALRASTPFAVGNLQDNKIVNDLRQLLGSEISASPETGLAGLFGAGVSRADQVSGVREKKEDPIANAGRKLRDLGIEGNERIESFVNDIEAIQPSERIKKQRTEGFDKEVFTGNNVERASQLVVEALPSLAVATAASLATGNPLLGSVLLGSTEGADLQREAIEAGASEITSANVGNAATVINSVIESLPLGRFVNRSKKATPFLQEAIKKKVFKKILARTLKDAGLQSIEEGTQEGVQQMVSNFIAKVGFDEGRDLFQGVLDSIVAGAGAGGATSIASSSIQTFVEKAKAKGATEEEAKKFVSVISASIAANKDVVAKDAAALLAKKTANEVQTLTEEEQEIEEEAVSRDKEATEIVQGSLEAEQEATGEQAPTDPNFVLSDTQLDRVLGNERKRSTKVVKKTEKATGVTQPKKLIDEKKALRMMIQQKSKLAKQIEKEKNAEKREELKKQRNEIQEVFRLRRGLRKGVIEKMNFEEKIAIADVQQKMARSTNLTELREAYNQMRILRDIGRSKYIEVTEARKTRIKAESTAITKNLLLMPKNKQKAVINQRDRGKKDVPFSVFLSTLRPARIVDRYLDGFQNFKGIATDLVTNRVREAQAKTSAGTRKAHLTGTQVLVDSGLMQVKKINGDLVPTNIDPLVEETTIEQNGQKIVFTKSEIMHMWGVRKNKENVLAVMYANDINGNSYRELVSKLSPEERSAADALVRELGKGYHSTRETFIRLHDGTKDLAQVKGGYVPMVRINDDPEANLSSLMEADFQTRVSFKNFRFLSPRQRIKSIKAQKRAGKIKLGLVELYFAHTAQREHFVNTAETIRDVNALLNDETLKDTVREKVGVEVLDELNEYLKAVADPRVFKSNNFFVKGISHLRQKAAIAFLGYNVITALKQPVSWLVAMNEVKPQFLFKYSPDVWTHWEERVKEIQAKDPTMIDRGVNVEAGAFRKLNPIEYKKLVNKIGRDSMRWIIAMDSFTVHAVWYARYQQAKQEGASEREAVNLARTAVKNTQPESTASELPSVLRNEILGGVFGQFQNQLNQNYNMMVNDIPQRLRAKDVEGAKLQAAYGASMLILAATGIYMASNLRLPSDEEDLLSVFGNLVASLPIVGPIISGGLNGFEAGLPASLQAVAKGTSSVISARRGKLDDAILKSAEAAALFIGIPSSQPKRTITGGFELANKESKDPRRLIISGGTLHHNSKQAKRKRGRAFKRNVDKSVKAFLKLLDF